MNAIIKWTLWQRRWSIFWWCISLVALVTLTLAFYPSVKDQAAELNKSLGSLAGGESTMALFGGTDFFSPVGYLNSQLIYLTMPIILAIFAIILGISLIGSEESSGTLDNLLSRPVARGKVLVAKAMAGIVMVFIVTFVASLVTIILSKLVSLDVPLSNIAAACFACFMLVLTFGATAFLLTATGRGRVAALGVAVGYGFGGYLISSLSETVDWLKNISPLFAYHYYPSADILRGEFEWSSIIFPALFTIVCGILAWLVFRRRDLSSE